MKAAPAILVTSAAASAGAVGALLLPWRQIAASDMSVALTLRQVTTCIDGHCFHAPITGVAHYLAMLAVVGCVATVVFAVATASVVNRGRPVPASLRRSLATAGALLTAGGFAATYTMPEASSRLDATWGMAAAIVATAAAIAGVVLTGRRARTSRVPGR